MQFEIVTKFLAENIIIFRRVLQVSWRAGMRACIFFPWCIRYLVIHLSWWNPLSATTRWLPSRTVASFFWNISRSGQLPQGNNPYIHRIFPWSIETATSYRKPEPWNLFWKPFGTKRCSSRIRQSLSSTEHRHVLIIDGGKFMRTYQRISKNIRVN